MKFPYERYQTLTEPCKIYYPTGEDTQARWVVQTINNASKLLMKLLTQPTPQLEILLVATDDWDRAPLEDTEELEQPKRFLPYWTDAIQPSCLVIPSELDPIIGEPTQAKLAILLYHELMRAFLEYDPRPWPDEYPLWADEWQVHFAALWLAQQIDGQQGIVTKDLREHYAELFVPEEDGKTPITVRGFDWDDETSPQDYLRFDLLLEQFAADLLEHSDPELLPRFLALYRKEQSVLLSDDVTEMLATALGPGGTEWLDELVYF